MHLTVSNYKRYFIKITPAKECPGDTRPAQKNVEMPLTGIVFCKYLLIGNRVALVKFFECFRTKHR
jgi:hypothetical protein